MSSSGFPRVRDNEVLLIVMVPKLGRVGSTASPVLLVSSPIIEIVGRFVTTRSCVWLRRISHTLYENPAHAHAVDTRPSPLAGGAWGRG